MVQRIESIDVVGPKQVGSVHPETKWERISDALPSMLRPFIAVVLISAIVWVSIEVLFSEKEHLASFRNGAWTTLVGIGGAAVTYFFGEQWRRKP
jgi:hypothetical protein